MNYLFHKLLDEFGQLERSQRLSALGLPLVLRLGVLPVEGGRAEDVVEPQLLPEAGDRVEVPALVGGCKKYKKKVSVHFGIGPLS